MKKPQGDVVERAVEVEGRRELRAVHVEDVAFPGVDTHGAGVHVDDVCRREDAHNLNALPNAADEDSEGVAEGEMVRLGESIADDDFIAPAFGGEPAFAKEEPVVALRQRHGVIDAGSVIPSIGMEPRSTIRVSADATLPGRGCVRGAIRVHAKAARRDLRTRRTRRSLADC